VPENRNENQDNKLSRRTFAQRAVLLSATASLAPAAAILPVADHKIPAPALPPQDASKLPKLSATGQAEADARLQLILNTHENTFDDPQKQILRNSCVYLQSSLEKVRAYPLENGDAPALYLKPLLDREKKRPEPIPAPTKTLNSTPGKKS
jgi:hypothetical protein